MLDSAWVVFVEVLVPAGVCGIAVTLGVLFLWTASGVIPADRAGVVFGAILFGLATFLAVGHVLSLLVRLRVMLLSWHG